MIENINYNVKKYLDIPLDEFQLEACHYIENNINVLVSAPTGSGKTAIAEYAIYKIRDSNINGKIIYTCPIKSLCNEKYSDMVKKYPNLIVGLMTGDIIINSNSIINNSCLISNNVTIGEGAIVGHGSVVIKNLEDNKYYYHGLYRK